MRGRQGKIRCENEPCVHKIPAHARNLRAVHFFAPSVLTIYKKAIYFQFAQKFESLRQRLSKEEIPLCDDEDSLKKKSLPLRRRRLSEEEISSSATKKTLRRSNLSLCNNETPSATKKTHRISNPSIYEDSETPIFAPCYDKEQNSQ